MVNGQIENKELLNWIGAFSTCISKDNYCKRQLVGPRTYHSVVFGGAQPKDGFTTWPKRIFGLLILPLLSMLKISSGMETESKCGDRLA